MIQKSSHRTLLIIVFAALIAAGIFLFVKKQSPIAQESYQSFNILLITLDTVRADRLPVYGYKLGQTPNIDRLAKNSSVFEEAYSHVPLTLPSHVSIMTGRLPIAHGVRDNAGFVLNEKEITLAETLKENGYSTGAFVSASVLESRWKINQGFDFYDDHFKTAIAADSLAGEVERKAEETVDISEQWLDDHKGEKFFMWVHLYDPHDPYDPPEPYKSVYGERPYDGEIAYVDAEVGKLLQKLQMLRLFDRTIIVLTSDHGEGLGEHNEPTHGVFLYNTTQHVPLMIYIPGKKGKRITGTIGHIDLAPTILELVGLNHIPSDAGKKSSFENRWQ